ncbi:acyl-CoA N-acyltransferase [Vararia minispora EC-137]|uniref:Acyl-CoA N-acyltransferase n=1 Tax=Vararia minispora EC-137 TaxID=1314806 RepID=A0ACB8QV35_9AGAM|nr:acyl-CoA N-acyltransferase [Vararia minispora EC-137]
MAFFIRSARPEDVEAIRLLIYALAVYEKEPESAKATPELLYKNLFEDRLAHALLAFSGTPEAPGEAIGLALYFFNFSTWTGKRGIYLEDLFVQPEHRQSGVGKALFAELGKVAQDTGCARMDWVVLKWNQPSIDFYRHRLGAKSMDEWMGMRLEEDGIGRLRSLVPSQD